MGYERQTRNINPLGDYYSRPQSADYGRDYGSGADYSYTSARDYEAAGYRADDGGRYGARAYDRGGDRGGGYGDRDQRYRGGGEPYRGSYAHDGRRFEDVGRNRHADDDDYRNRAARPERGAGRPPEGYDRDDRGFFARAGDEVRSWFGDEDAERRRDFDARYDDSDPRTGGHRDDHYHSWRRNQIAALDRDYDEYRSENRTKFENEFTSWRTERQGQRDQLPKVTEHMDVVGSDGEHVGTVDKVRGDRILLTKNDVDAGGQHHSIPSRWIDKVDSKVTLRKSADEAKSHWRDEERNQALFGDRPEGRGGNTDTTQREGTNLNRSFSGTY